MADDVDPEVDALFDLPADEFVAARDALAKARRAAGDRAVAAATKQLRRPTLSAWVLNQLARRHPDDVRTLVEQGAALAEAQEQALAGARVDLREAGRARTDALRRLTRAAESIFGGQGSAAHRDEVVATLTAASSDPASAALLLEGRLSEPLEAPSGFGGPFTPSTPDVGPAPAGGQGDEGDVAPARAAKARRGARTARPEEGPEATAGSSPDRAQRPPRDEPGAADVAEVAAASAHAAPEGGAGAGPPHDRAALRLVEARGGRKARGVPAGGTRRRASGDGGDAAPGGGGAADGPGERPDEEVAAPVAAGGPESSAARRSREAEAAAAAAQADAARAAAEAEAVAERVAALEEELAQARVALGAAEQEAGRRRRAAAAATAAAHETAREVADTDG